ncbi:MAG: RDD family protein [Candidatus Saccharicenans sp.]|nr:RDD family protein [Candidatus Saccharicenans sp.]
MPAEYLNLLRGKIPEEEYRKTSSMKAGEIMKEYRHFLAASLAEQAGQKAASRTEARSGDRTYKIIKEYIITLLYFVLFSRLKSQTPGKKLLGLKVIDLEGKPRLGWYQCFERAHSYICSGFFASPDFWQVLWDRQGLTMHDRISSTTVIRLPSTPRVRKIKKSKEKSRGKEKTGENR